MLEDFQIVGAEFLAARKAALLADEMRIGKTRQAIRAADMKFYQRINIFCPTVALWNWVIEYGETSVLGLPVNVISTGKDKVTDYGVNVCPFSLITNEAIREPLLNNGAECTILDEVHYLKNPEAQRTKAVYGSKREKITGLIQKCKSVWALSGTPMPNDPSELWPLLRVFGVYNKSLSAFINEFCVTKWTDYDRVIVGAKNTDKLRELLRPVTLRRLRKYVLNETPPVVAHHYVQPDLEYLDEDIRAEYLRVEAEAKDALSNYSTENAILNFLDNTNDFGATLRRLTGLLKIRPTADLAREILKTERQVVIFAVHRDVVKALAKELKPFHPVIIMGGMGARKKQDAIELFRTKKPRVLIGNVQAAGESADFSTAAHIIGTELSTVPKDNNQAFARCSGHRQTRQVQIDVVTLPGSTDYIVNSILIRKLDMINAVF